jgi:hypothetical protein
MTTPIPVANLFQDGRFVANGVPLSSLRSINALNPFDKKQIYCTLVPPTLSDRFGLNVYAPACDWLKLVCQEDTGSVEIAIYHPDEPNDPMFYLQLADTPHNQLLVLLFVVNDPHAPRFDIDRDREGRPTKLGTVRRNHLAEEAAMRAGLAPGQIRQGLKLTRAFMPSLETFVARLGHKMFMLEPLAYHTAILFERYGCAYSQGRVPMEWINQQFAEGGSLRRKLDGSTPFRQPEAYQTVRGRSWAIQDGILNRPFSNVKMYKTIGVHAGINTFPGGAW